MFETLEALQLRFICDVSTVCLVNEYKGSMLRGAFISSLIKLGEGENKYGSRDDAVAILANGKDETGHEQVRPYVVEPPIDSRLQYMPGDSMEFSITLFGHRAMSLYREVVFAALEMGSVGIGKDTQKGYGKFSVVEIWVVNPYSGLSSRIYGAGISNPDIRSPYREFVLGSRITNKDVVQYSRGFKKKVRLDLKTPLRFETEDGVLVGSAPSFNYFANKLVFRLHQLNKLDDPSAVGSIRINADVPKYEMIRYKEVERYSSRQDARLSMGGLVGWMVFDNVEDYMSLLCWGLISHVGKYSVLGHGKYVMSNI